MCKGYSFSDNELEEKLGEIAAVENCHAFVYYAVTAMEDWSPARIDRLLGIVGRLRRKTAAEVSVLPIFAEPGSPWVSFPGLFGGCRFPFVFKDFLREWQKPLHPWNDLLTGVDGTAQIVGRFEEEVDTQG